MVMQRKRVEWIAGPNLSNQQRTAVLSAFVYRWTRDNPRREAAWKTVASKPRVPLVTDQVWLSRYEFPFKPGTDFMPSRPSYCRPIMPPPPEPVLQQTKASEYTQRCLLEM